MAQYKVLQDIEAEDKLLGPLSMRQFIYAAIVIVMGFVAFKLGTFKWFLVIPFVPPIVFFGLLAAPFGRDQSSEVWLLAKIRFFVKPRRRIWDQSGLQDLVTITVPKKIEKILTKGFSQDEVKSRLSALATTLDTRGWAVKNVDANTYQLPQTSQSSDRLIDISNLPQQVPSVTVEPEADILDDTTNPVAQNVDHMMSVSAQEHRQELLDKMKNLSAAEQQAQQQTSVAAEPITNSPPNSPTDYNAVAVTPNDQALLERMRAKNEQARMANAHLRTLPTPDVGQQAAPATPLAPVNESAQTAPNSTASFAQQQQAQAMTPSSNPAILNRVNSNDDLKVDTLAKLANNKSGNLDESDGSEVVISLH